MKLLVANQKSAALTLTELLVVIFILFVLFVIVASSLPEPRAKKKVARINCINNLKQIGLAYQIWARDNNGKFPMEISTTNGGTREVVDQSCWMNYLVMSNELSTPKILICPSDDKHFPATNFSMDFSAKNISYFVGLDAATNLPMVILSGDDNLEVNGNPVEAGVLKLSANSATCWTTNRHRAGNIGFADGRVELSQNLNLSNFLSRTGLATNRLAIP
jgi:prepilin-type processing-associated H-X9-DG protein